MSDTPKAADDVMKLLDRGFTVVLFKNDLGSYTAVAARPGEGSLDKALRAALRKGHETDDFTPSQALYRLTEKVFGNIA